VNLLASDQIFSISPHGILFIGSLDVLINIKLIIFKIMLL
jgi:hypothetical protein